MQTRTIRLLIALGLLIMPLAGTLILRAPFPTVVTAQDRLRIVIEEVQLPVAAFDKYGHRDPGLTIDDLLVLEDGTPQDVRSVRQIPANVVLLLDTGGEVNPAKNIRTTREIAKNLVTALNTQDQVAIFQISDKAELLQDWTSDFKQVGQILDTKLLSGKRSNLSDGLIAAVSHFGELPLGSRHLVLITDGVESPGGKFDHPEALKRVAASNTVVHVIGYTNVSGEATRSSRTVFRDRTKSTTPDEVVATLPHEHGYDQLRRLHQPGGMIADIDPVRLRRVREYERKMREGAEPLTSLCDESGGHAWLPDSFEELFGDGAKAARLIDAEYVVTYKPKRAVISAPEGEVRRVEVMSRRVGLTVVSRHHYIALARK